MKTCCRCGLRKNTSDFAWRHDGGVRKRRGTCKACLNLTRKRLAARPEYKRRYNERRRERRIEKDGWRPKSWLLKKRWRIREHLLRHPCVEFDHVRGEKSFTISLNFCDSRWNSIEEEIKKCDVRCTNCHLRKTIATSDNDEWFKVKVYKEAQNA